MKARGGARTGAVRDAGSADDAGGASPGAERAATPEDPRFREAYAEHRAREGRGPLDEESLLSLPYLDAGPFAREWAVRARSFDAFVRAVLEPLARSRGALRVLDVGAGNGWLCWNVARRGHTAVALDVRTDAVDGLGAAAPYRRHLLRMFGRVAGSFERLPFAPRVFDLVVFNASLHYATDLPCVLGEAVRVARPGGRVVVLDSPFYRRVEDGEAMAAEKRSGSERVFGELAPVLGAPRFVEYLTPERLHGAHEGLRWEHVRVRYPLWYKARPLLARAMGGREPSWFDVWWAEVG